MAYRTVNCTTTSRLLSRTVSYISNVKYNNILQSCNKPVRIRLSHLINVIRTRIAAQGENKLGTINIFQQFPFTNLQNMNQLPTVSGAYKMPLYLIAVYSLCWKILASMSIISVVVSVSACNIHINIYFPSCVFRTLNLEKFSYININTGRSRWSCVLRRRLQLLYFCNRKFESL